MRRTLMLLAIFLLAVTTRADVRGTWHMDKDGVNGYDLELSHDNSRFGSTYPLDAFRGLTTAAVDASSETPAHFQLVRDAGTFDFTGTFRDGDGVGRFTFVPDASYTSRLRTLGVAAEVMDDRQMMSLAALDVSTQFIGEMQALGYRAASLKQYETFRIHGATPAFVRAMQSLGYSNLPAEQLVAFRIHGVTTEFVRSMASAGYASLSAEELVRFRIHGVTADFARDLRALGVHDLSAAQLVAMRIHGVTTECARDLAAFGYRDLSSQELVTMRIHGVSTEFIRDLADAGYRDVPVEKLVSMKIHGVDADFIRKAK